MECSGSFVVDSKVVHRGIEIEVAIDDKVQDADKIPCDFCSKKFKMKQVLVVHRKCVHLVKNVYVNNTDNMTIGGSSFPELDEQLLSKDVMNTLSSVNNKVVRATAPFDNAGKKRRQYTTKFKAEVIFASEEKGVSVRAVASRYGLDHSVVVRWIHKKAFIIDDAASSHCRLLTKARRSEKHVALHAELFRRFKEARSRGHRIDFQWLSSRARMIQKEQAGEEPESVIGKHVVVQFLNLYKVKIREKQRNKKKPQESFRKDLEKWHVTTRERFLRNGFNENYDPKWDRPNVLMSIKARFHLRSMQNELMST